MSVNVSLDYDISVGARKRILHLSISTFLTIKISLRPRWTATMLNRTGQKIFLLKKISLLHQQMCKYINPGDILILLTNIWNIIKGGFRGGVAAPKIISNNFFLFQYYYYYYFFFFFFFFLGGGGVRYTICMVLKYIIHYNHLKYIHPTYTCRLDRTHSSAYRLESGNVTGS